MKKCKTCGIEKPVSEYYKKNKDGSKLFSECKKCFCERSAKWQAANKERKAATNKKWEQKNWQRVLKNKREWRKKKPEVHKAIKKRWCAKNKDKTAAEASKKRASRLQRTPSWADLKEIQAFYTAAQWMTELTGEQWHVDHIVPLRGKLVSGLHVENNLQLLKAHDNLTKLNKWIP